MAAPGAKGCGGAVEGGVQLRGGFVRVAADGFAIGGLIDRAWVGWEIMFMAPSG
ncbi:hypothetical protein PFWH6_3998 [Pseudomonas fluorescens WH6]|nr:hypothetical protein PFWH6_3998 [Pseudomonas fluorescens WH6]